MNNVIFLGKNYIAGLSEEFKADLHQHPVLEIYAACDGDSHVRIGSKTISGQIIAISPGALHAIADDGKRGLAVFIDPLSETGYSMKEHLLQKRTYEAAVCEGLKAPLAFLLKDHSLAAVCRVSGQLMQALRGDVVNRPFNSAVLDAISLLSEEEEDFTMEILASRICLSKSRLAHLFSEQTGIALKSYLQYKRLERALLHIISGSNITEAAMDTGFSGSSHISASGRRLTGMQIRKLLNL